MPRGSKPGERRGGRQKGIRNRASIARQAKVAAEGETPLDVMLDNMRFFHRGAAEALARIEGLPLEPGGLSEERADAFRDMLGLRKAAGDAAKEAAPYVHPRFAAIAPPPETHGEYDLSKLSDAELDAIERISRKIAASYGDRS